MDLSQSPFIVIWETTQACDLACVHCRAEAQPNPLPDELTHAEGLDLIDHVAKLGARVLVLSGGDPLKRRRLTDLIRHGKARKLRMGTIPAATPRLTREAVRGLKDAGLDQMALSLDASTAEAHDRFRGVTGAFQKTMEAVGWAHEAKLPLQINTVMSALNFEDLDRLIELVRRLGIVFWEVFFLVPVGRGTQLAGLTAEQYELVFAKLYETARAASFVIKVTEALHYRRYSIERQRADQEPLASTATEPGYPRSSASQSEASGVGDGSADRRSLRPAEPAGERWRDVVPPPAARPDGPRPALGGAAVGETAGGGIIGLSPQSINAGKGHLFISSTGEVYPSGFLPLSAGNIRATPLAQLYRASPLFLALRNPDLLKGRCGICEFRSVCGGSRSRAYALTGDVLAEDPCCAYVPAPSSSLRVER